MQFGCGKRIRDHRDGGSGSEDRTSKAGRYPALRRYQPFRPVWRRASIHANVIIFSLNSAPVSTLFKKAISY
jgi:hypothetical protein